MSLEDFEANDGADTFKTGLAGALSGVDPAHVTLQVVSGSLQLDVAVLFDSYDAAQASLGPLRALTASPENLTAAVGLPVSDVQQAELVLLQTSPPLPPQLPLPPGPQLPGSDVDISVVTDDGASKALLIGLVVGTVVCVGCMYLVCVRQRRRERHKMEQLRPTFWRASRRPGRTAAPARLVAQGCVLKDEAKTTAPRFGDVVLEPKSTHAELSSAADRAQVLPTRRWAGSTQFNMRPPLDLQRVHMHSDSSRRSGAPSGAETSPQAMEEARRWLGHALGDVHPNGSPSTAMFSIHRSEVHGVADSLVRDHFSWADAGSCDPNSDRLDPQDWVDLEPFRPSVTATSALAASPSLRHRSASASSRRLESAENGGMSGRLSRRSDDDEGRLARPPEDGGDMMFRL